MYNVLASSYSGSPSVSSAGSNSSHATSSRLAYLAPARGTADLGRSPVSSLGPPSPASSRYSLGSSRVASTSISSATPPPSRPSSASPSCPPFSIEVFGDSFCSVFTLLEGAGRDTNLKVHVNKFKGASARGLNNPDSTLQAHREIVRRIRENRPQFVILQFGAVDIHINYLWQLKAKGSQAAGPSEFVHSVASNFCQFLESSMIPLARQTGIKIYVASVAPPVVEDQYLEQSVMKYLTKSMSAANAPLVSLASSEITGPHDLTTRHAMVKLYNQILSRFCASRGHTDCLSFVDINRHLVASSSLLFVDRPKRVGRRFVDDQDPTNIHLVWERTIRIWCAEIPILRGFVPALDRLQQSGQFEARIGTWQREKQERHRERPQREDQMWQQQWTTVRGPVQQQPVQRAEWRREGGIGIASRASRANSSLVFVGGGSKISN